MTGQRFGKWTVLCRDFTVETNSSSGRVAYWICKCDCGNLRSVNGVSLRRGISKSCGCDAAKSTSERNTKDLTGSRIGKLQIIGRTPYVKGQRLRWICLCDCGKMTLCRTSELTHQRSCGCLASEINRSRFEEIRKVKGDNRERLHRVWLGMRSRCIKPNNADYESYGGRGITICEEWSKSYLSFREWAYSNGYDENAPKGQCTLDRIDVNGNYCPENCRWVNMKQQSNNRRKCKYYEIDGTTHSLGDWCEIYGVDRKLTYSRVKRGWDVKRALTEPKHVRMS